MDKLANMEAFAAVAETESFAEAARRLNIANSVVSKRVKDLEDFLGTQLLVRTTRKVSLTEGGYDYLDYVRKFLDELAEVEGRIRYNTEVPRGTIRIAAPLTYGLKFLGPALSSYMEKYPEVTIKTYLSDKRISLIDEGYDLTIRSGPLEDSSLMARKLENCRLVIAAAPQYWTKHGKPQHPDDLRDHNCMTYLNTMDGRSWPFMMDGRQVWLPVEGSFSSDSGNLLEEMAIAGLGIIMLPTFIVGDALEFGKLETALENFEMNNFNMYAVYQNTRHLSIKIRTLIDHLVGFFAAKAT